MITSDLQSVEISHIGDFNHAVPEDVILVRNDRDYVKACDELSKSQIDGGEKRIWVRNQNHYVWLQHFAEDINVSCVFREKTARLVLAESWNVSIPDWLDDETVIAQDLLDLEFENTNLTSFWVRLLSHLLSSEFEADTLGAKNLPDIITSLCREASKAAFEEYPVLSRCLQERCSEWRNGATEKWVKDVCERLPNNAPETWAQLSDWSILHGYPENVLGYVLPPHQLQFVRNIPIEATVDMPIEPSAREQVLTQIKMFFEGIKAAVTSSTDFQKVLGFTSGRLHEEFHQILTLLKANQFDAQKEDVEKVREKFQSCPGVTANQLSALAHLVQPKQPRLIRQGESWNDKDWIDWTVHEYLPYREWQVHAGHFNPDLEETVKRFSEWYVDEYVSIHQNPQDSLIFSLNDLSNHWGEALVIVLIVDCLPIPFIELVDNAMVEHGLSRHEQRFRFSALPTVTAHNKPQLLSGQWSMKKKSYAAMLKERAERDWQSRKVEYVSNLKGLSEMEIPSGPATIVLNFIDGDELLHEDMAARNTTHEEELSRIYIRMAEAVRRIADGWAGLPKNFHVHVVTDHGACQILDSEKSSFDSQIVNKLFPEEKYRFATISESKADEIPQNLWDLGMQFKPPFGDSDDVYFIPKGHNTVRTGGQNSGYTHGGATPEEVIVPVAMYKPERMVWKSLLSQFIGLDIEDKTGKAKFFIQRVIGLELKLQNPNAAEIRVLRASILSPDTDLKDCTRPVVPASGESVMKLDCYFRKAALEQTRLDVEIVYEIAGSTHTALASVESHFKSAVSSGFSLKDL